MANQLRWLLLLFLVAGCATKRAAIMPPAIKRAKGSGIAPPARTHFLLSWEDCSPQSNVWYRVFETNDFKNKRLYAEVTNAHSLVIAMTNAKAFYTVEITNGRKSKWAGMDCE